MNLLHEPAWVADEQTWAKAKKAAQKQDPDNVYALTTYIYKKMGGKISSKGKQADSGSAFPQALRAEPKERDFHLLTTRFTESDGVVPGNSVAPTEPSPSRFNVVLIEEGMGNLGDAFYYTKEALQSAAPVFEGKKIYADHPTAVDEEVRPERSVRDILGWFQNVRPQEASDGRTQLVGEVLITGGESFDWARDLMKQAVDYAKRYADKQFVGLSINAHGEAAPVDLTEFLKDPSIPDSARVKLEKALGEGIETVRKVAAITEAISCDLVTEAGAGGKVLSLIEQEKKSMSQQHPDEDQDKKLIDEMMAKYMDGPGADEADKDMAGNALRMAKEMGYKDAEAQKMAAGHVKMLKHSAKKTAEAHEKHEAECKDKECENEAHEKHPAEESEDFARDVKEKKESDDFVKDVKEKKESKEHDDGDDDDDDDDDEKDGKDGDGKEPPKKEKKESKESLRAQVARLEKKLLEANGKIAAHEERAKKIEIAAYLNTKMSESKLPNSITKKFRETIGDKCKSKVDVDEKWSLYKAAYEQGKQDMHESNKFVFSTAKFTTQESDGKADGKFSLADCVR